MVDKLRELSLNLPYIELKTKELELDAKAHHDKGSRVYPDSTLLLCTFIWELLAEIQRLKE